MRCRVRDRPKPVFSGFGRSRKWRRNRSPVMAVTETTAESGGSLTAVTKTETDCRPTDNDSRSKRSMRTEAVEPDHQ